MSYSTDKQKRRTDFVVSQTQEKANEYLFSNVRYPGDINVSKAGKVKFRGLCALSLS